MDSVWREREAGLRHLPQVLWILFLATLGLLLGAKLYDWTWIAAVAFLIYPRFWKQREALGKRSFAALRLCVAVWFTMYIAYTAWQRGGEPVSFGAGEAKAAVAAAMRDPSSAEFRDIRETAAATCGEVNGTNAYGGYAGFTPFVYQGGTVLFEPKEPIAPDTESQTAYLNAVAEFARAQRRCYE